MYSKIKKNIKNCIPPILLKVLVPESKYGWFGSYPSWNEAKKKCIGYDSDIILEKCKNAALKVRDGEAVFERDSVLFYEKDYAWLVLSGLLCCAAENSGKLNVLDFGGSFGSSYYQNLNFLSTVKNLSLTWSIVEQQNFVECGKKYFQNEVLKFYSTVEECSSFDKPNVLLLSGVLQYLENPFEWLNKFISLGVEYIIVDRTAFIKSSQDIISVQNVPPSVYNASYPAWSFNEKKFLTLISSKYDVILENYGPDKSNFEGMYFKGFIFKLKK